jgi:hypothetical protein
MAKVTITYAIPTKSIGGFVIDVFKTERYGYSSSVTDIPLEDGSLASDHVVINPLEIRISAFIGMAEFSTVTNGPSDPGSAQKGDPKARIRAAHFELLRLMRERQPITVVTGLDTFPNMIITSYDIDRDVEKGADLQFDMAFREVRIVKSETVKITASTPAGDQIAGYADMGVAGTTKVQDDSAEAKYHWRLAVKAGRATREDFYSKWGEYP